MNLDKLKLKKLNTFGHLLNVHCVSSLEIKFFKSNIILSYVATFFPHCYCLKS